MNGQDYTILYIVRYPNGRADTTRTDEYSCADYRAAMLASWRGMGVSVGYAFGRGAGGGLGSGATGAFPIIALNAFRGDNGRCKDPVLGIGTGIVRYPRGDRGPMRVTTVTITYDFTLQPGTRLGPGRGYYTGTVHVWDDDNQFTYDGPARAWANCVVGWGKVATGTGA
jgi:hypothetical protein